MFAATEVAAITGPSLTGSELAEFRRVRRWSGFWTVRRMANSIICERAFEFGRRTIKLCVLLERRGIAGRHLASQLIRCGTSIGANAEEAQEAQTKPSYISCMSVSRKESRETRYWLRLGVASETIKHAEVKWELDEVSQLLAMIRQAIKTAQSSSSRGE